MKIVAASEGCIVYVATVHFQIDCSDWWHHCGSHNYYTIDKDKTSKTDGIKNISQQDKIKVV